MTTDLPVSLLEAHVGYWLRFVSNHVSHAFRQKIEARGVTVAEWVVLRELLRLAPQRKHEIHPSQIAEGLGMTRGAISKLVDRLIRKKLVKRTIVAGDQRYQSLALTAAGEKMVPALARLADENDAQFFGHLSFDQRDALIRLLREIVHRNQLPDVPID